jgi:HEAT repeat protein
MKRIMPVILLVLLAISRPAFSGLLDPEDKWDRLGKLPAKEYKEALKAFKEGLEKEKSEDKITAVKTFGAVEDSRVIDELGKLFKDRDAKVRLAAAEALVSIRDLRSASLLTRQLKKFKNSKPDAKMVAVILVGLGRLNYKPSCPKMADMLDHTDPVVKEAACYALADIVPVQYVPEIIKQYEEDKEDLAKAEERKDDKSKKDLEKIVNAEFRALRTITGESFSDPDDYRKWWRKNRGLYEPYGGLREGVTPKPIKTKKAADEW